MLPEVSVIVPAYNASAYIADCIQSVKTQTCTSWELIIINDGSTDKTVEIINNFLSDSRIKLVNQQNKGVSAARNKGIEVSLGKYIAFLDADDCFLGNNLQLKCEALDKNPAIDFAYSDVWRCDEKLNNLYIEKGVDFNNLFFEVMLRSTLTIPGLSSNLMLRASSIKSLGLLFDENLSNCADWYMKILLATRAKGIYISEALAKYRNTPGSMSKKVSLLEHDEEYIIRKIIETNILPQGAFRRKIIATTYFTLSGSWYKDARKPLRAIKYALKAFITSPFYISAKAINKIPVLVGLSRKS